MQNKEKYDEKYIQIYNSLLKYFNMIIQETNEAITKEKNKSIIDTIGNTKEIREYNKYEYNAGKITYKEYLIEQLWSFFPTDKKMKLEICEKILNEFEKAKQKIRFLIEEIQDKSCSNEEKNKNIIILKCFYKKYYREMQANKFRDILDKQESDLTKEERNYLYSINLGNMDVGDISYNSLIETLSNRTNINFYKNMLNTLIQYLEENKIPELTDKMERTTLIDKFIKIKEYLKLKEDYNNYYEIYVLLKYTMKSLSENKDNVSDNLKNNIDFIKEVYWNYLKLPDFNQFINEKYSKENKGLKELKVVGPEGTLIPESNNAERNKLNKGNNYIK